MRVTILSAGSMELELEAASPLMLAAIDGVSYGGQGSIAAQVVAEVFCEMAGDKSEHAQTADALQDVAARAQRKLAQLKRSYDVDRTAACTASGLLTVVNRLRDSGAAPELVAEAMEADAHVITRAFGMDGAPSALLDLRRSKYVAGDVFVVCTDGLSDVLGDEEMAAILSEQAGRPAQRLVERALAKGSTDNVTAIVARVVG